MSARTTSKNDLSTSEPIPEDENYIYIQESYQVEWRMNREEAENFMREGHRKSIDDFAKGSKKPERINQTVQVQDSRAQFAPGSGDKGSMLEEQENENKEPTVSKGPGKISEEKLSLREMANLIQKDYEKQEKDKTSIS